MPTSGPRRLPGASRTYQRLPGPTVGLLGGKTQNVNREKTERQAAEEGWKGGAGLIANHRDYFLLCSFKKASRATACKTVLEAAA